MRYIVKERDKRVGGYTVRTFHPTCCIAFAWSEIHAWFATRAEAKAYITETAE